MTIIRDTYGYYTDCRITDVIIPDAEEEITELVKRKLETYYIFLNTRLYVHPEYNRIHSVFNDPSYYRFEDEPLTETHEGREDEIHNADFSCFWKIEDSCIVVAVYENKTKRGYGDETSILSYESWIEGINCDKLPLDSFSEEARKKYEKE